jgi:AcrR family transcriptional regulator
MRITADAKKATRERILEVAQRLFQDKGFDETTIRDIAAEVGMATGTLFNYFASKEDVAVTLAEAAIGDAEQEFAKKRREGASLSEDLFLQVATQLRHLRRLRKSIQPVIDTALAMPAFSSDRMGGSQMAGNHLQAVVEVLREHEIDPERWARTAPVYWALYVGVLNFWGHDQSPKQEDTLAMLDQARDPRHPLSAARSVGVFASGKARERRK